MFPCFDSGNADMTPDEFYFMLIINIHTTDKIMTLFEVHLC